MEALTLGDILEARDLALQSLAGTTMGDDMKEGYRTGVENLSLYLRRKLADKADAA